MWRRLKTEKGNIFFAVEKKTEKDIWKRKTYFRGGKEKQRSKRRKTFGEGTYIFTEEKEKEKNWKWKYTFCQAEYFAFL